MGRETAVSLPITFPYNPRVETSFLQTKLYIPPIRPNISHTLTTLLQSPQPLPAKALAAALVNALASVSTPCLLILDDYHEIDSAEIDLALAFLLDHMFSNLHLIITSRADPGFPLSRLRARNQLTELRAQDLRFSVDETAVSIIININFQRGDVQLNQLN